MLLSKAAEIVATAYPHLSPKYVLAHARQFVRSGFINPERYIGEGPNARALITHYDVCRTGVLSLSIQAMLDQGDVAGISSGLDHLYEDLDHIGSAYRRAGFRAVVDSIAESPATTWFLHRRTLLDGSTRNGVWRNRELPDTPEGVLLHAQTIALTPIIAPIVEQLREAGLA